MRKALLIIGVAVGVAAFLAGGFALGRATRSDESAERGLVISEAQEIAAARADAIGAEELDLGGIALPETPSEAQEAYIAPRSGGVAAEVLDWNRTFGVTVFDLEGDGDADLLVNLHNVGDDPIWVNRRGGLARSNLHLPRLRDEESLIARDRHNCDAADVDADGDQDLYCTTGLRSDGTTKSNELWIQSENEFQERLGHGAEDPSGHGGYVRFFDFDGDPYPDLFVTNRAVDAVWAANPVFRNEGDGTFTRIDTPISEAPGGRCQPEAADWNGDGLDDLAVCHSGGPDFPLLYESGNGTLSGADEVLGNKPPEDLLTDTALADLNDDGWVDLVVATSTGVEVRYNDPDRPNRRFGEIARRHELEDVPRALAIADLNGDGLPDVYVAQQGSQCFGSRGINGRDVILLAPDWRKVDAPYLPLGCSREAAGLGDGGVVVANGFENTPGALTLVRPVP